jgi:hypothetical protein
MFVNVRFRFQRGLKRKPMALIKKLRTAVIIHIPLTWLNYQSLTFLDPGV